MLPDYENAIKFNETNYDEFNLPSGSLGSIYITGGGFVNRRFTGFGLNGKFGWQELVWKKSPPRASANLGMPTMDSIPVGLVARCELNCGYMNIQDYLDLRKIVARQRHFLVTFFDIDDAKWVTRDMYCTENSYKQLNVMKQAIIGNFDVTIKFAGTNNDLKAILNTTSNTDDFKHIKYTLKFNANGGTGTYTDMSVYYGQQVTLADSASMTPPSGKHFKWWVQKDANNNILGYFGSKQSITVWGDMNFYAEWENAT